MDFQIKYQQTLDTVKDKHKKAFDKAITDD